MFSAGLTSDATLQIIQALLYWTAWVLLLLACLGGLATLAFVCRECFHLSGRRLPATDPPRHRGRAEAADSLHPASGNTQIDQPQFP